MIQTETTPNPDSLKFLCEKTLSIIGNEEFKKEKQNERQKQLDEQAMEFQKNIQQQLDADKKDYWFGRFHCYLQRGRCGANKTSRGNYC